MVSLKNVEVVGHPGTAHVFEPIVWLSVEQTGPSVATHKGSRFDALRVAGGESILAVAPP